MIAISILVISIAVIFVTGVLAVSKVGLWQNNEGN